MGGRATHGRRGKLAKWDTETIQPTLLGEQHVRHQIGAG